MVKDKLIAKVDIEIRVIDVMDDIDVMDYKPSISTLMNADCNLMTKCPSDIFC